MHMSFDILKYPYVNKKKYWQEAARQFSDVKMITIAALIVALRVAVKLFKIPIAQGLSISLDGYINSIGSIVYGPLVGLAVGAISDLIGCAVAPNGPFFPPFTLVEMASSFIFGLFFWKRKINMTRALTAKFTVNLICNIIMTSIFMKWSKFVFSGAAAAEAYNLINAARIVKNLIMFPLEATIIVVVMAAALPLLTKLKLVDKNYSFVDKPSNKRLIIEVAFFTALSVGLIVGYIYLRDIGFDFDIIKWLTNDPQARFVFEVISYIVLAEIVTLPISCEISKLLSEDNN